MKRARIREALLQRLVRDRDELRQRLKNLSTLADDVISAADGGAEGSPAAESKALLTESI